MEAALGTKQNTIPSSPSFHLLQEAQLGARGTPASHAGLDSCGEAAWLCGYGLVLVRWRCATGYYLVFGIWYLMITWGCVHSIGSCLGLVAWSMLGVIFCFIQVYSHISHAGACYHSKDGVGT